MSREVTSNQETVEEAQTQIKGDTGRRKGGVKENGCFDHLWGGQVSILFKDDLKQERKVNTSEGRRGGTISQLPLRSQVRRLVNRLIHTLALKEDNILPQLLMKK